MSWTKESTWISIIVAVGIIAVSLMNFGNDLNSRSDIELNKRSTDYIRDYNGFVDDQQIDTLVEDRSDLKQQNFLTSDNETGAQSSTDFLGLVNWGLTKLTKVWDFFVSVYNIPSFLLLSAGLDVQPFRHVLNTFTYAFSVILIIILLRRGK